MIAASPTTSAVRSGLLKIDGRPAPLATLTIEPNVTLRFKRGGLLLVDPIQATNPAVGALVAAGTASQRITFTSAESPPAAGDWLGIYFNEIPNMRSKLDFVDVVYAGGSSIVAGNTNIRNSAGHGIDRGWVGSAMPSFLASGNSFSMVRYCRETYPRPSAPTPCQAPASVPCP
jgi:hypothetical protein